MKTIKIGVIGFGTIGTGVVKTFIQQKELLRARTGMSFEVAKIADLDITTSRGIDIDPSLLTTDVNDILNDPEIQLAIELMGGYEPAKTFMLQALRNGKHVVTANKALLAVHGQEIFETAEAQKMDVGFEASVGGGIPIIRSIREGLVANNFSEIYGILNGTTNYILTEMTEKGEDYEQVLKRAMELGYAEPDPTFDVEGIDATHKIILLTYLAFGQHVTMEQVFTEGVSQLTSTDITFATELGYKIKLLAITRRIGDAVEVRVHPTMLHAEHLLAKVDGSFNAIYAVGDIVDSTMSYGHGAGMMPTASAVVSDIVDIARNMRQGISNRIPLSPGLTEEEQSLSIQAPDRFLSRYYLRFKVLDHPGVLSKISGLLGEYNISIASVIQKEMHPVDSVPLVMLTYEAYEHDVQEAIRKIEQMDSVTDKTVLIRVLL
ncbi:MAG: homoserine dehydrogenase [bacterium]|nr:homoserine dehydrogenase [bacterium]